MSIQTFGDLVNFHPHLHAIATEGCFGGEWNFLSIPRIPPYVIKVIYRSKRNPFLKRNFQVFEPLEWIAAVTSHIPDKGQQMVRYYGYYSNKSRGKRKKEKGNPDHLNIKEEPSHSAKEYRRLWAQLIQKVYEVDPLICSKCGGTMRIVSFIEEQAVINKILTHLGIHEEHAHSPPEEEAQTVDIIYEPHYDDLAVSEIV